MTAMVIVSVWPDALATAGGLSVSMALAVLIAHLAAYRPTKVKRVLVAVVTIGILGTVGATVARADDEVVITDPCKNLTTSDPMYWVLGCFWPI